MPPAGSLSYVANVAVNVFDINQPSLPTPFYSVLVYTFVFMAFPTVFHSINSPDNSPLSHSVHFIRVIFFFLEVLVVRPLCSIWPSPDVTLCG